MYSSTMRQVFLTVLLCFCWELGWVLLTTENCIETSKFWWIPRELGRNSNFSLKIRPFLFSRHAQIYKVNCQNNEIKRFDKANEIDEINEIMSLDQIANTCYSADHNRMLLITTIALCSLNWISSFQMSSLISTKYHGIVFMLQFLFSKFIYLFF